eukprot:2768418-Rhodomonas_salina.2
MAEAEEGARREAYAATRRLVLRAGMLWYAGYAVSGTESRYAATRSLVPRVGMSGTEGGYAATQSLVLRLCGVGY